MELKGQPNPDQLYPTQGFSIHGQINTKIFRQLNF